MKTNYLPELNSLKDFFKSLETVPQTPFVLSPGTTILDLNKFVETHVRFIENNKDNEYFEPYLERLFRLKIYINNQRRKKNGIIKN